MSSTRMWLGALLFSALACAPLTPGPGVSSREEFHRLCQAVGTEKGRLAKDQFLAQAKDKEAAARLFDACDQNQDGFITEEEIRPEYLKSLKAQVLRLTTPPPPTTRGF
uniref:EF-hand domain-containing protein n=1 Tax=Desulfobacca acetoxidans TaxID=60893 RepID=A0A7C5EN47_9BACT